MLPQICLRKVLQKKTKKQYNTLLISLPNIFNRQKKEVLNTSAYIYIYILMYVRESLRLCLFTDLDHPFFLE